MKRTPQAGGKKGPREVTQIKQYIKLTWATINIERFGSLKFLLYTILLYSALFSLYRK